ncbi:uncharacterized protein LOC101855241 [Aplysia californica]|uniref:Uncharacterized protein LOC101855241 n=1 Tax=Aplysia californica TaxID=6500 RepID=A0ABM0ZWA2_APLCA|nr:uncharacterized protein LOC101855241 [Aplysia californica]
MDIQDPLDFLAKYCIINPDRLPFYEIIFESTVAEQTPKYTKQEKKADQNEGAGGGEKKNDGVEEEEKKKKGKSGKKKKSAKEKQKQQEINPALLPTERGMNIEKAALTIEEQHLEKLIYTLDTLHEKMLDYGQQLEVMEVERTRVLARRAKDLFPEITSPDYFPKLKKKGKKGKKDKKVEPPRKLRPDEITPEVIVGRLDDKRLSQLTSEPDMKQMEAEIDRLKDKIRDIQMRVEQIASEKLLADAFCMNHYFLRQGLNGTPTLPPTDFKRQQSELYNRLHPHPDFEMNLEEVEEALQQINNHLITEKEFFFLYNILNLPGRERINFRLFSIIAALSEKVSQLDPVIRKMINNFNYNALDIKMEKCKELFELLEAEHMPRGGAQAASLAVELTAGGLKPEHTNYVLHKFNRENRGVVDFLDFVTYVPLFVEIHKRIVSHPLSDKFDL